MRGTRPRRPPLTSRTQSYEADWRHSVPGRRPNPLNYLDGASPGEILALLRTDLGLRWESGEHLGVEWYRRHIPDLSDDAFVALIYEEFCLREDHGQSPLASSFFARFPEVASSLKRVLDIHDLVGSGHGSSGSFGSSPSLSTRVPFPEVGQTIAGFRPGGRTRPRRVRPRVPGQGARPGRPPGGVEGGPIGVPRAADARTPPAHPYRAGPLVSDRPKYRPAPALHALFRQGHARAPAVRQGREFREIGDRDRGHARPPGPRRVGRLLKAGRPQGAGLSILRAGDRLVGGAAGRGAPARPRARRPASRHQAVQRAGHGGRHADAPGLQPRA